MEIADFFAGNTRCRRALLVGGQVRAWKLKKFDTASKRIRGQVRAWKLKEFDTASKRILWKDLKSLRLHILQLVLKSVRGNVGLDMRIFDLIRILRDASE